MEGFLVGIDLCDTYTQVCGPEEENLWTFPTVICRGKSTDEWYIGENAYAQVLRGDGILVDRLVNLTCKDGTATLGDIRYEAAELMRRFLSMTLDLPIQAGITGEIHAVVIAVRRLETRLIQVLTDCLRSFGFEDSQFRIISHAEGFVYDTLSQKKEIWNGTVGMFDLSDEGLRYYELKIQRGPKKSFVLAEYEEMEERFDLDLLETPQKAKVGDTILCACAERMMRKKLYSAVFLCGKGFESQEWAQEFMKLLSVSRRIFREPAIFARGALLYASELVSARAAFPFICVCDGHLKTSISMNVLHKGQETVVTLASAGDNWYERSVVIDVIPDKQDSVDFMVTPLDVRKKKTITVPLEGFPQKNDRTMKVRICLRFLDDRTMSVEMRDLGFGELFPSSGAQIRQEVML